MNTLYLVAINLFVVALHIVDGEILFNSTANLANGVHSQCSINSLYSWQCDSGQCIQMDELCDGVKNCDDGTDETVEHCLHKACPSYAFQCTYGGCIPGNYRCNGISDCWDGSDENRFMCNYSLNYTQEIRGDCWLSSQMQCKSGECISNEGVCDGVPNCNDGSDETVDICSFFNCPEYAFRCGYGACVAGSARCNGIKDCLDGSDEFPGFCATIVPTNINETMPQRPDYVPSVPGGVSTTYKPPIVQTTVRRGMSTTYKPTSRTTTVRPTPISSTTESWIDVRFGGDKYNYCKTNTLRRGISTIASCSYNNQNVSCYDNVRLNTTAHLSCASGYTTSEKKPNSIVCDFDGEWTHSNFKCSPLCGELTPKQRSSVIKPWDVTIFKRSDTPIFQAICSGVIVSPNIVITVANCLPNTAEGYNINRTLYNVVEGYHNFSYIGGNLLRKGVHKIRTIKIVTKSNTEGLALFVVEDPFQLSHSLKPVCLPTTRRMSLSNGDGPVNIGRGVTHESSREYLEKLIQSTITENSGESKTYIQYMRIQKFVPAINREIARQTYLL